MDIKTYKHLYIIFIIVFLYYNIIKYINCPNHDYPNIKVNGVLNWKKFKYQQFCFRSPLEFLIIFLLCAYVFYKYFFTIINQIFE